MSASEFGSSWLVQRLRKPAGHGQMAAVIETFAFGGGLVNGGLPKEAMAVLRDMFSFDYMGSAEFEWGAVPKAFGALAKDHKKLTAFSFTIPLAEVAPNWRERKAATPDGDGTVYVICRREHAEAVQERIRAFAAVTERTKERVGLDAALRPVNEWDCDVCGWLELDNGFLFFTDEAMWSATATLFGAKTRAASR